MNAVCQTAVRECKYHAVSFITIRGERTAFQRCGSHATTSLQGEQGEEINDGKIPCMYMITNLISTIYTAGTDYE